MSSKTNRRIFLKNAAIGGALLTTTGRATAKNLSAQSSNRLKVALNAYSFNKPLQDGEMTIEDVLDFCAEQGFFACDMTAYYLPGYPEVPKDEYLHSLKRKSFLLGLEICGTGIRTDFTDPDPAKRASEVALVKNWIVAAEKLGAPVIRVFAGPRLKDESQREQVLQLMIRDLKECVEFGKNHGVVVAVQNHNDFILTPEHTRQLIDSLNSEWFGLIMDTGGYRSGDPYKLIAKSIEYAVNWQIKEKIFVNGVEEDTNIPKLIEVIKSSGYRGYLPIETLGPGDPKPKILKIYNELVTALK